jgi:hypothetical protein
MEVCWLLNSPVRISCADISKIGYHLRSTIHYVPSQQRNTSNNPLLVKFSLSVSKMLCRDTCGPFGLAHRAIQY